MFEQSVVLLRAKHFEEKLINAREGVKVKQYSSMLGTQWKTVVLHILKIYYSIIIIIVSNILAIKKIRIKFYNWLKDSKIDIVFLQETHYSKKNETLYDCFWSGKSIHCFSDSSQSRDESVYF